jgi:UDP-glucose 4-epimerase
VYRYTTREAILKLRAQQRLRPLLRDGPEPFRYEPDVEEFLRWSPSVRAASNRRARTAEELADSGGRVDVAGPPVASYDDLSADEVIGIAASLEATALAELRRYEVANRSRTAVLAALDRNLASKRG